MTTVAEPTEYADDGLKKTVELLRKSHQKAVKAIKQAEAEVTKTMAFYLRLHRNKI